MNQSKKSRLDISLVQRSMVESRQKAQALIMAGKVLIGGIPCLKASTMVDADAALEISKPPPYVSRGGTKLKGAVDHFGVQPKGLIALDIGASTGGFTDCFLQEGAARVYAVDVGRGQLDWRLRNDQRVIVMDKCNARYFDAEVLPEQVDICTIDVSFISLDKIIPAVMKHVCSSGYILALIKPQFELKASKVGKGGIVREESYRKEAMNKIETLFVSCNVLVKGVVPSCIQGAKGNIEYFILGQKT